MWNVTKTDTDMEFLEIWHLWIIAAAVLIIIELFSGMVATFCLAIGCVFACFAALFGAGIGVQLLALALGTVLAFMLIPPLVKKHRKPSDPIPGASNMDALIGRTGKVVEAIHPGEMGRVKIDGDNWQAVAPNGGWYEKGSTVRVTGYDSIILSVE